MTKEEIKKFVQEWMNSHEEDTFIKNEHGVVLYSSGHTSLNLTCFFEDLLTEFIESENERLKAEREWISVEDRLPETNCDVLTVKKNGRVIFMSFHAPFDSGKRIFQWWGFGAWVDQHRQVTHWMPLPKSPEI